VEFNLQGALANMPAGELRFAVGASDRENDYRYIPDSLVTNAAIVDNTAGVYPADASFGAVGATDVYGELLVPLLANKRGVEELTLELGYRQSSNEPTEDVDSYKALLDWRLTDRIRIRGGHQVANRAPNVAELFQSREQQFYYINNGDWCSEENPVNPNSPNPALNPNAAQVKAICESRMGAAGASVFYSSEQPDEARSARWFYVVGNPNLVPESAGTTTVGVVANIAERTTLSVDYWNIKISDMVSSEYVETFHEQCFSPATNPSFDPNHPSCLKVLRNQSTGGQSPYFVSFTNAAAIDMAGFDISVDWSKSVGPGLMSVNFQASVLDHAETQPSPDTPAVDWKGSVGPTNISGLSGYSFDYRTITRMSYSQGDWTASLGWQHKPSVTSEGHITNPTTATEVPTDAYNLFDLHGRYSFGDTGQYDLRFGIDNLLDEQPEIIFADATSSGTGRTDANIYDILGRRFYVGLKVSF
jgi:outer membrane receptor protein involved in Fe transport